MDYYAPELDYFLAFYDSELDDIMCAKKQTRSTCMKRRGRTLMTPAHLPTKRKHGQVCIFRRCYVLLTLMMATAHVKKHVLEEYRILDDIAATHMPSKNMTREWFVDLVRYLHCADNDSTSDTYRLWKIQ